MLFKHAALGDERAFMTVKSVEATSITLGMGVALAISVNGSFDGTSAVRTASGTAGNLPGFLGIATQNFVANQYGLIQIFGNCASVLLSNVATSVTIATGDPLIPSPASGALSSSVPSYAASGFNWVIASSVPTNTISVAAPLYCSGFIRCIK